MELRHLRYFVVVAEEENITRAAAKLNVSQPGLSRQIRDLESELGFPILARKSKGVRLTEPGRVFAAEARAVLARAEMAVSTARSVATGTGGRIHVGYAPSLTLQLLPPILRGLQALAPNSRVKLHDLSTEEMFTRLHNGKLDAALMVHPSRARLHGLHFDPLAQSGMFVAVPPDHPLARRSSVQLSSLAKEPFIAYDHTAYPEYLEDLRHIFESIGIRPALLEEHDGVSSLITDIAAGRGIALVPETIASIAGSRLCLVPLRPALKPITIGVVRRTGEGAALLAAFVDCAKNLARNGDRRRASSKPTAAR